MARNRYVTRNCHYVKVMVSYVIEGTNNAPVTEEILLAGSFKNMKELIKKCTAEIEVENARVFNAEVIEEINEIRGMTESEWLKHSVVMPTRTRMN